MSKTQRIFGPLQRSPQSFTSHAGQLKTNSGKGHKCWQDREENPFVHRYFLCTGERMGFAKCCWRDFRIPVKDGFKARWRSPQRPPRQKWKVENRPAKGRALSMRGSGKKCGRWEGHRCGLLSISWICKIEKSVR